jgi:putative phosphoesterase
MRIGLIADIHADLSALQRALDLLEREGVDQVVCAGDLIEGGGEAASAVIQALQARAIPCVMGNHDEWTIQDQAWLRQHTDLDHPGVRVFLLDEAAIAFLKRMPKTRRFTWEGRRLVMAHGVPWGEYWFVYPNSGNDLLRRVASAAQAEVVILGHTHLPMLAQVDGVWIVNPGSVCGTHTSGSRTCAILTLPDGSFEVYDIARKRRVTADVTHTRLGGDHATVRLP